MKLTEISILNSDNIKRDATFHNLGLLNHNESNQFSFLEDIKYINYVGDNVSALITTEGIAKSIDLAIGIYISEKPKIDFYKIHNFLIESTDFYNVDFKTDIDSTSFIHKRAIIADKNVIVGKNCYISANATIEEGTIIGDNTIIRSGAVIGTEGFQFIKDNNEVIAVKHAGGVKVGNNVEIQANSCVSRALFKGYTIIDNNTKIADLVHITHNVYIGNNCLIAANALIAGSAKVGNNVWIGPSVTISSGVIIEDDASLTIGSVVTKNVKKGDRVTGNFAINHDKFIEHIKKIK